jgi:phosphate:Na+ symporter
MALSYITDELEHVGDVASKNIAAYARKKTEEGLAFSEEGLGEMRVFHAEVEANLKAALACIATWDQDLAHKLVQKRQWGVDRRRELHDRHLGRLSRGLKETLDTSTVHLDFIADLERVNFHCTQIAESVMGSRAARVQPSLFEPGSD